MCGTGFQWRIFFPLGSRTQQRELGGITAAANEGEASRIAIHSTYGPSFRSFIIVSVISHLELEELRSILTTEVSVDIHFAMNIKYRNNIQTFHTYIEPGIHFFITPNSGTHL
jgi:hypothetical protein